MLVNREEFEKLDEIKQGLRHCHYNESTNDYHSDVSHEETHEWHTQFVNGAWYAWQEQQKKMTQAYITLGEALNNTPDNYEDAIREAMDDLK